MLSKAPTWCGKVKITETLSLSFGQISSLEITIKRVLLFFLFWTFSFNISKPYNLQARGEAIAAFVGLFESLTYLAAIAVSWNGLCSI